MASSTSTLRLLPVTPEDIPAITTLWYQAFSPGMLTFFPDTPAVRQWWTDANAHDLAHKTQAYYVKVVDESDQLIAYAKWDTATVEERGARFPAWHETMEKEVCDGFFDRLERERERLMGGRRHYYLDMLATHPDSRRRGAGSMLVKWGCDLADRHGVATYVDASKDGAPLYRRFGFEDRSDPARCAEGIASMVRDARLSQ